MWKKSVFGPFRSISGRFGPKRENQIFPEKGMWVSFKNIFPPTHVKNQKKPMRQFSDKLKKVRFRADFGPKNGTFSENSVSVSFSPYGPLTPSKESEKINEPILRKVVTDGETARP